MEEVRRSIIILGERELIFNQVINKSLYWIVTYLCLIPWAALSLVCIFKHIGIRNFNRCVFSTEIYCHT